MSLIGATALLALVAAAGGGVWWWMQHRDTSHDANILLHTVQARRLRADRHRARRGRGVRCHGSPLAREIEQHERQRHFADRAGRHAGEEGRLPGRAGFVGAGRRSARARRFWSTTPRRSRSRRTTTTTWPSSPSANIWRARICRTGRLIESELFVAEENLNRAKEYYTYSQKLASKGYVNENQLEADRFAVEKANKDLDAAKTKLKVLDEFTKPKQVSTLESAILIAKAKWDAAQNSDSWKPRSSHDLDDQIAKCTMTAPQDGVVKYAHVTDSRGDQQFIVEEGTIVRERQTIIKLPNADSMRVNLTVNESLVQYVQPGLDGR